MNPLLIYFWGIADNLSGCFKAATIVAFISGALALFMQLPARDGNASEAILSKMFTWAKRLFAMSGCFAFLYAVTPSSNTIALMYVLPEIANSAVIQKDLPEVYDAAKKALLEKIKLPAEKQ